MTKGFPWKAAIFDLDGTLLDSLDVWSRVDAEFFARRGLPLPDDYADAVAALSFDACARYTKRRFQLPESEAEIRAEWLAAVEAEYARRVPLKPGAAEYLRALRRAGVRLGVATALPPRCFRPCLERHGLLALFDALVSNEEGGSESKADGRLFREAAARLGVAAEECLAFDDVCEGVLGARAAGMRAVWMEDPRTRGTMTPDQADLRIAAWKEAPRPNPAPAGRAVIFTAWCEGDARRAYAPRPGDYVLAADGGWEICRAAGFRADELLGDFDSMPMPEAPGLRITRFPVEKDDTDTILCIDRALALGYDDILLVGGAGGRLDHTLANVQALVYALDRHARIALADGKIWMTALRGGEIALPRRKGKLSVFALSETVRGVTISGTKYELTDGELHFGYPLGVSNEFDADAARVSVREGTLLILAGCEDPAGAGD